MDNTTPSQRPYLNVPAILVEQAFSSFYLTSIKASKLVKIVYSFPATYGKDSLDGVQRGINKMRVDNIAKFCQTENVLFPNSVILAANILQDGSYIDADNEWTVTEEGYLEIPSAIEAASIVDGQHRIEGIKKALDEGADDFDIVCSIYMDLPAPRQAEVFATINFNQQKVDKSLAYQLFGYDLDATESSYWAPDTVAISLTRILNSSDSSPFKNHIAYGIKDKYLDFSTVQEKEEFQRDPWKISTASMVEGIVRLISANATEDRYELHKKRVIRRDRTVLREIRRRAIEPWRSLYLDSRDRDLYDSVENYFISAKKILWDEGKLDILKKTIGIQALFDLLKEIAQQEGSDKVVSISEYDKKLERINIEAVKEFSLNYSGKGRSDLKNILLDSYNSGR